jgi:glycosyltransferase involved in cell wall biosynthesis
MKVFFITSSGFKEGKTGDATQGRETVKALRERGIDVVLGFVKYSPFAIYDESDNKLDYSSLKEIIESSDLVHLLPGTLPLCKYLKKILVRPTLASSIFWGGMERVYLAFYNNHGFLRRVKASLRELRNQIPLYNDYRGVDVFLPNTKAEGLKVMQCFRKKKGATFRVAPNGFVVPSFDVWGLERSERVPKEDYIVVPGTFAQRKNQLGFIRAIKNEAKDYKIVFMGGAHDLGYFEECKKASSDNMFFIGHLSSADVEYWRVLRYARVACLPSDCETPGIAMIEAAYAGARPVITKYGGTEEYYGDKAVYLNPCRSQSIRNAIERGWQMGRLEKEDALKFSRFSWNLTAQRTIEAYEFALNRNCEMLDGK